MPTKQSLLRKTTIPVVIQTLCCVAGGVVLVAYVSAGVALPVVAIGTDRWIGIGILLVLLAPVALVVRRRVRRLRGICPILTEYPEGDDIAWRTITSVVIHILSVTGVIAIAVCMIVGAVEIVESLGLGRGGERGLIVAISGVVGPLLILGVSKTFGDCPALRLSQVMDTIDGKGAEGCALIQLPRHRRKLVLALFAGLAIGEKGAGCALIQLSSHRRKQVLAVMAGIMVSVSLLPTSTSLFQWAELGGVAVFGGVHYLLGEYEQGLAYHQQSLEIAREIGIPVGVWHAQYWIGEAQEHLNHLEDARTSYADAIDIIESLREKLNVEKHRTSFIADKSWVYERMIPLLLRLGEEEEAFSYLERAKSRSLLDMLGNRRDVGKGKAREMTEEERRLQGRINSLLERIGKEKSKREEKQRRGIVSEWEEELGELRKEYADLLVKIEREDPELASLVSVRPLDAEEVQDLLDEDTTILEYFVGRDTTVVWVLDRKGLSVVGIDAGGKALGEKIGGYREVIGKPGSSYEEASEELYALLIAPVREHISTEKVCIIPHGVLHYLPFQTLSREGRFLLEEYEVFYAPSASVLRFVFPKRKERRGKVLALGNPDLGDPRYDLRYAEEEVRGIQSLYPESSVFLREEATESRAKTLSSGYGILHFAGHGEMNPRMPLFSALRLVGDEEEDGRLEVHELFGMDLPEASLVVMSACETGVSDITKGDELIGLMRGFIYAGTPSIVATLWSVDDRSTAELMGRFYGNLRRMTKVESLREAQVWLRGMREEDAEASELAGYAVYREYSHPYYWGSFILVGDWM